MSNTGRTTTLPQDIQSFLDIWISALRAKDVDAYAACYTDDVRVFDGMNPPQFMGLEAWKDMIVKWFGGLGTEADLKLQDIQLEASDDLAVITSFAGYVGQPEGATEPLEMWCRQTSILRRTPDGWKICHEHSSVPFDEQSGQGNFAMRP